MRIVASFVLVASLVFVSHGQEAKLPLTIESIEALFRNQLPDETLATEIRERGVDPLLPWQEIQRLQTLGIGTATTSALERFVQPSNLTVIVEPPLAGLPVSVAGVGFRLAEPDRDGITDSSGRVVIEGLRPGTYKVTLTPPPTHRVVELEIVLHSGEGAERIKLAPAPAMISVLTQDATVEIGSVGSYKSPFRNKEVPAGFHVVSIYKANHLTYRTLISVEPGERKLLTPTLKREPMKYPVVHRHNWARCWGTLFVSDDTLEYRQLGKHSAFGGSSLIGNSGKHSFVVPITQISKVDRWSPNQLSIVLSDGRDFHFAHGELRTATKSSAATLEDFVDVRPIDPVIESIRRAQGTVR